MWNVVCAKGCNNGQNPRRGQDPSLQYQWLRDRRGEQCSPVQFRDNAKLHGASRTPPPTTYTQISAYPVRARLVAKTMAASQQSWPTRAVQCPTEALIAARPRNNEHRLLQSG